MREPGRRVWRAISTAGILAIAVLTYRVIDTRVRRSTPKLNEP